MIPNIFQRWRADSTMKIRFRWIAVSFLVLLFLGWYRWIVDFNDPAVKAENARLDFAYDLERAAGDGGSEFRVAASGPESRALVIASTSMTPEIAYRRNYRGAPLSSIF
jgi:hypothetical protein